MASSSSSAWAPWQSDEGSWVQVFDPYWGPWWYWQEGKKGGKGKGKEGKGKEGKSKGKSKGKRKEGEKGKGKSKEGKGVDEEQEVGE